MPAKHIRYSESLLGLGGFLLSMLKEPATLDELWMKFEKINNRKLPAYHSFDNVLLALDFLFLIGALNIADTGELHLCD
ncbi:MAG: hypothetical protein K9J37_04540 [Saprospiraceae bacterium]|nr:hypothetical protein [Saprospiraceae bacterium]MCF8249154.1 hypothetical protein [Saprospiraceae bacterium]MCF8278904.1 hypothetical protein [Bacteroidales bacterium]MCF8311283.1 hypothetical protein [Saprospiraceae bacterium]MCF8440153.1 hypothetical protein [Saprospiraceae bacterium]